MWWVDLGDPKGSAPGLTRPVVVLSADTFNRSKIATVTVAVITSNMRLAAAPGNVILADGEGGLPKPSVVNVSQVVTVDKTSLIEQSGALTTERLDEVERGLRLALSL